MVCHGRILGPDPTAHVLWIAGYTHTLLLLSPHGIVFMYTLILKAAKQNAEHGALEKITLLLSFHHPFTANIHLAHVGNLTNR